jgi:hypothetical protein
MITWCKQKNLLLLIICSYWGRQSLGVSFLTSNSKLLVDEEKEIATVGWTAQLTPKCEIINSTYQEIYSFETEDYYINICQLGDDFYYHRQAKFEQNTVLIPAQAVFSGNVFQATDGKTDYFVGKNGDRYYSSVMKNNHEIVFEPELQQYPALSPELTEANATLPRDLEINQASNASLELDNPDDASESVLICTQEKSAFHPFLAGWQKLRGKSTAIANENCFILPQNR